MSDFFTTLIAPPLKPTDFVIPWLVMCGVALVIWAYYHLEGRRRIAPDDQHRHFRARQFVGGLGWIGLVGAVFAGARWADLSIFAWVLWLALWGLGVAGFLLYWVWYLSFKYPAERAAYEAHLTHQQYLPKSKR